MKKMISIVLILVLSFCITGCGNDNNSSNNKKETVTDYKSMNYSKITIFNKNNATYEQKTLNELTKLAVENEARFKRDYQYSKIRFVAKVNKVSVGTYYQPAISLGEVDLLKLGEDFDGMTIILSPSQYDLADFDKGDLVYVESNILYADYENYFTAAGSNESTINLASLKTTEVKAVNNYTNEQIDDLLLVQGSNANSDSIKEITYNDFKNKINETNNSIVLVSRSDCSHCISYKPVIKSYAEENNLTIYMIDTNNITNSDDYNALWDFLGAQGTPTTAIIGNGKLIAMHEGEMTRSELTAFLKENY